MALRAARAERMAPIPTPTELSFAEVATADRVARLLRAMGVQNVKTGVGKTGVTGEIIGEAGEGPTVLLRADMDGLPIQEDSDVVPFASTNTGVMHACGHDGHMAALLGAAHVLARNTAQLRGKVVLCFQPAEEGYAGAQAMIDDGVLDGVEQVYGMHLWTYDPTGVVGVQPGPCMAYSDRVSLVFRGAGGHGAAPQNTVDSIVVASHVVTALQTIVSRNLNPLDAGVVTVGSLHGGSAFNIIAEETTLHCTVRSYKREVQELLMRRIQDLATHIAAGFGASVEVDTWLGYPATVNRDDASLGAVRAAAEAVVPAACVKPPMLSMGGEDFAYFLNQRPGCFFFVGAAPADKPLGSVPHHKSVFELNEDSVLIAASVWIRLVEQQWMGGQQCK